ncbi:MAG: hypothetical protein PW791_09255 [Neorhizobium sp.]|nr:hypothetical protein [Neorhizobium sp.]
MADISLLPTPAQIGAATAAQGAKADAAVQHSELGGAAGMNVGKTSGTVAAGDDSRITGAVQSSTKGAASGVAALNSQALVNDTQNRLRDTVGNGLNPVLSWRGYTELVAWTVSGGTLSNSDGNMAVAASGGTGYLQSPLFSVSGLSVRYVAIRHKLVAGSDRVRVYWRTASHGFTSSYYIDGPSEAAGIWRTTVLDLWNPTAGGTDWKTNSITQLRFDGIAADGGSIECAWIGICSDNPARGDSQNDIRYLRKLSSGELSLADSSAIKSDGNSADAATNTAEIATLLASLPSRGGSLKIPAGSFAVTCGGVPTVTNKHIAIVGLGLGVSEFLATGSSGSLFAVSQNDHALNTTFQDFSVRKHSDASTSGTMLDITYPAKTASQERTAQVRNIQCRGDVEVGTTQFQGLVRVTNAWHPLFENLDFEGMYGATTAAATVVLDQRCSLVTAMNIKGTWAHSVVKNQAGYGSAYPSELDRGTCNFARDILAGWRSTKTGSMTRFWRCSG